LHQHVHRERNAGAAVLSEGESRAGEDPRGSLRRVIVITSDTEGGIMKGKCTVVLIIILISAMSMAGCVGSPSAPMTTPVPATPAPVTTAAPVIIPTTWPTLETPANGHPSSKTYSFEGTGDDTQIFTTTSDGTWVFRMNYPGDEVFIVTIKDESGDDIEVLANEGGSYTGTKSMQLDAGTYYLDVAAAAPWTITMSTA
jgi:hypothetical protein